MPPVGVEQPHQARVGGEGRGRGEGRGLVVAPVAARAAEGGEARASREAGAAEGEDAAGGAEAGVEGREGVVGWVCWWHLAGDCWRGTNRDVWVQRDEVSQNTWFCL